ncbi:MAG: DNA-binding response regulator [Anaerolineae bacterium UTCFX2]|jgi:two-component system response regulator NreC|nr:response regulator transcription factor [Anaerolineales bacterium]OQY92177.1 MAG: DNA-binding response regulator [Anaerolineae bacterium UTCFX2]
MSEIQLLLVDDHEVVRTGLRMLLENQSDMVILAEASTGNEAIELVDVYHPNVVVMDITLPDISGIEATRRLKAKHPKIAVVALTIHEDEQYFFEMLQAGASGYVPKRAAPEDLISAIRAAYNGEIYLYPSLAKALVSDYLGRSRTQQEEEKLEALTPREQEILELLAEGLTNDEIAEHLVISRHTVARHRENLMRKLDLHNRSELVKYAIRKGLIAA